MSDKKMPKRPTPPPPPPKRPIPPKPLREGNPDKHERSWTIRPPKK